MLWPTATAADAPPFFSAATNTGRCCGRKDQPDRPRIAWPQLDDQEAQAVGLPDVRPARRSQHHPPRLTSGWSDVEEGQETAGQGQTPEACCPHPGAAETVHPSL